MSSGSLNVEGSRNEPPPLPQRPKSMDQLKATETNNTDYAQHVQKHVREVRRRNVKAPKAPELKEFQETINDKTSTQWFSFIQAWIKYIISASAYDDINRPLEPLSLNNLRHDLDRLYPMISPLIGPAKEIRRIYRWENKSLTSILATFYLVLWYYDLIMSFLCTASALGIIYVRLDMFAQLGVETLDENPKTDATVKSWNHNFWMRMKTPFTNQPHYGFNFFDDMPTSEWRTDVYKRYGPLFQMMLTDTIDYMERIKNLFTWKRPIKTRLLLALILSSSFLLSIIPFRLVCKMAFLYVGFEFFVLQALRSHYPRHRRLFNILNLLLWDVPNDAEYALEVMRVNHTKKPSPSTSSTSDSMASSSATTRESQQQMVTKRASTSELLNADEPKRERLIKINKHNVIQDTAATTAASFAMLAAAATLNKVKKTIDNRAEKKRKETEKLSTPDEEDKQSQQEDPETFGCMYKGSIPGRITLRDSNLIFRTSRATGGNILVECDYNDIIGVKKTKNYNMLVWHANGIEITTFDNQILSFESVFSRDECFNQIVSASGNDDCEWKKM
ncbi:hypothetical protein K501DRAFT_249843 [Backusella circina FSU 941]|nr:hypothetical protein K501DRAFT_249843 [Backusella circina FSU 941]